MSKKPTDAENYTVMMPFATGAPDSEVNEARYEAVYQWHTDLLTQGARIMTPPLTQRLDPPDYLGQLTINADLFDPASQIAPLSFWKVTGLAVPGPKGKVNKNAHAA